ncbi:MAG: hypothetical protein A8274_285 [Halanaerobium sp. 4-GBenrich]|nr:MAG: hypothetical protein A8274_285 [Halanaerobium sp. 4-GBenrich]
MTNKKVVEITKKNDDKRDNRLKNRIIQALNDEGYLNDPAAPSRIDISIKLDKSQNNKKTEIFIRQPDE